MKEDHHLQLKTQASSSSSSIQSLNPSETDLLQSFRVVSTDVEQDQSTQPQIVVPQDTVASAPHNNNSTISSSSNNSNKRSSTTIKIIQHQAPLSQETPRIPYQHPPQAEQLLLHYLKSSSHPKLNNNHNHNNSQNNCSINSDGIRLAPVASDSNDHLEGGTGGTSCGGSVEAHQIRTSASLSSPVQSPLIPSDEPNVNLNRINNSGDVQIQNSVIGSDDSTQNDGQQEISQDRMEIQAQQILKRIQRLQGKQCQKHITKHVKAFVRHEQLVSGIGCQMMTLGLIHGTNSNNTTTSNRYNNCNNATDNSRYHNSPGVNCRRDLASVMSSNSGANNSSSSNGTSNRSHHLNSNHNHFNNNNSGIIIKTSGTTSGSPSVSGGTPVIESETHNIKNLLKNEDVKSMSTKRLVNLVKQLENSGYPLNASSATPTPADSSNSCVSYNHQNNNNSTPQSSPTIPGLLTDGSVSVSIATSSTGSTTTVPSPVVSNKASELTLAKLLTRPPAPRSSSTTTSSYPHQNTSHNHNHHNNSSTHHKNAPYSNSDRIVSSSAAQAIHHLDPTEVEQIESTLGTLKENIHHLETDYDSDATESSSGGDSCDDEFMHSNHAYPNGYNHWMMSDNDNLSQTPGYHYSTSTSPLTPSSRHKNVPSPFTGSNHNIRESISWKWAVERGAVASRWMWLFAQVADLEFKIRQQNEMYRNLRLTKGPIVLEARADNPLPPPVLTPAASVTSPLVPSTLLPPDMTSSSQVINPSDGVSTTSNNSTINNNSSNGCESNTSQSVRTMPVRNFRKRRLVRSSLALASAASGLTSSTTAGASGSANVTSTNSKKMARYSTVQCSCSSLPRMVTPCLICSGRYSYVQVIDTDCMPLPERIALLDASCHPVISLPNQISLGLHFSKFLKKETVNKTVSPSKSSQLKRKKLSATSTVRHHVEESYDPNSNRSKFTSKAAVGKNKSQSVISSNKLKKKYNLNETTSSRRKYSNSSSSYDQTYHHSSSGKRSKGTGGKNRERHESSSNGSADSNYNRQDSSPLPTNHESRETQNAASGGYSAAPRRRRSELQHAFDINNIVIPYSIASTTRVEKLQYKEILTPKWREIPDVSLPVIKTEPVTEETSGGVGSTAGVTGATSTSATNDQLMTGDSSESSSIILDGMLMNPVVEEDLSDVAFAERHKKCEIEEKKRFLTFLTPAGKPGSGSHRGRSMRCDSKSEKDLTQLMSTTAGAAVTGTTTPSTPTPTTPGKSNSTLSKNGFGPEQLDTSSQDSIINSTSSLSKDHNAENQSTTPTTINHTSSKIVTTNSTPENINSSVSPAVNNNSSKDHQQASVECNTIHGTPARASDRRRTTSSSRREDSFEGDNLNSSTGDNLMFDVVPFEKRIFPLDDSEYENLLKAASDAAQDAEDAAAAAEEEAASHLISGITNGGQGTGLSDAPDHQTSNHSRKSSGDKRRIGGSSVSESSAKSIKSGSKIDVNHDGAMDGEETDDVDMDEEDPEPDVDSDDCSMYNIVIDT